MRAKTKFDDRKVRRAARSGNIESLGHAGGAIRLAAQRSIRKGKTAAPAGQPPRTRKGRLKQAIQYAVETSRGSVVVGPNVDVAGTSGAAHEHGGQYRDENYPQRPFMGPALQKVKDRLPAFWAGSVRGG
jgi:phage gpG-like protein